MVCVALETLAGINDVLWSCLLEGSIGTGVKLLEFELWTSIKGGCPLETLSLGDAVVLEGASVRENVCSVVLGLC